MQKLVKRTIWRDHMNLLVERQSELLEDLKKLAQEGFPKAQEEWEKSVIAWGTSCCASSSSVSRLLMLLCRTTTNNTD